MNGHQIAPATGTTTRIETIRAALPMSRLGAPSSLPRFRWQQPMPDRDTPPARGLTAEESAHGFDWGKDSILPYGVYADYDRSQQPGEMPLLRLTNGRIEIDIAPQYGGRLVRMYDRRLKRDLVFHNPVFQPANLAALNAWFSGGIEWNGLIPGHTPFTCAPVFAGVIETERGPVLRIYEFDRITEATWQVDLFLPNDDDRLFVHGRIVNAAATAKRAYWWTNIAVAMSDGMRVIAPADYAIEHVLPGNELARFPFPDPQRFDGSYPGNWQSATSVFYRKPDAPRLYIAALDHDGVGLAQTATAEMRGRKMFYFGEASGGQHWMEFLARPGDARYIEIQSGITPTQNQRFELAPESELHWTEAYGALSVDAASAHAADYATAERATADALNQRFPADELAEVDGWLTAQSRRPLDKRLSDGAPWGSRQERLTGRDLAAGLDFAVGHAKDCWDDLVGKGAFSTANLETVPTTFAVSDVWVAALEQSGQSHGTWLHDLLLGIAALDREEAAEARDLFARSASARPTWLALRQLALVADTGDQKERFYMQASAAADAPDELAVEIAQFLLADGRLETLTAFVAALPKAAAAQERILLARASIAARCGDWNELERLLATEFATIREGEMLTVTLWTALQKGRLEAELGRPATKEVLAERMRQNPLPQHLDFQMLADEAGV
ncbi:MAG TPA: DUF5107 domain-containing protein [Albidovulum sp.]|uniref:DUF5107 domain-containing protein n=1 Tax=Albidovulum sp. TaxID=1872424 RepID=UPI002C3998C8|nr:DUF5107 domain-containing protein [Albidovulum sp.]